MTIWIITICYCLTMILFAFYLSIVNKTKKDILKNWGETNELNHELIETNKKLLQINDELIEKNRNMSILEIYLLMTVAAEKEEYQNFTQFYQKLYFLGVPKETLDNVEKLQDFMNKIADNKISVSDGKKPFVYTFYEKK